MKSQKAKLIEAESRMLVTRGVGVGELGRCWSKRTNLQSVRRVNLGDLTYNILTVVNNTICIIYFKVIESRP